MSLKIDRVQLEIVIQQDSARQQMIQLEEKMRSANKTLNALKKQFGENSAEYKAQEAIVKELRAEYDGLFEKIGLGNLSLKELGNRQKELNAILRNLPATNPLWKQYNDQLTEVNTRIKELKGTADTAKFSLSKMADGFNKYAAMGAGVIASLTGVALTARKCVDEFAQMEEAESQVRKYTGMTTEEVKALNEEFKSLDTRTARTRLNELAGDAGKLGITGTKDVLEFVEAANMIDVALGEDLGEDAIKNIGKLAEMFGDSGRSMKDNMLAIGSAVNEVAQNSSAAEPYLVEFTARMGGVAKQAKLSVTDVMGFASALDQNMLRSEMASTALQALLLKLYQEPAKYAKLAGMDVEQFTKLMETDANEAMLQFLGSLGKMGSMDKMAPVLKEMKLSGAEAAGVISALAGNVEKVRKEQETANQAFRDGTSIVNEYGVQNSTVQAELDKAKKHFADIRVELGERLLPMMKYMITTGSTTVKGMSAIISILIEYKTSILLATTSIAGYTIAVNASIIADKVKVLWTGRIVSGLKTLYAVAKANPWGMLVTVGMALVGVLIDTNRQLSESERLERSLQDIRQRATHTVDIEAASVRDFLKIARDENQSKEEREAAIRRLNEISPEYLGNLTLEKINTEQATASVNSYVDSLLALEDIKQTQQKIAELNEKKDDIRQNGVENGFWENTEAKAAHVLNSMKTAIGLYTDQWADNVLDRYVNKGVRELQAIDKEIDSLNEHIEEGRQKLISIETKKGGGSTKCPVCGNAPCTCGGDTDKADKAFKERDALLKKAMQTERNLWKEDFQNKKVTEEEYNQALYDTEIIFLTSKKALLEKYGRDSGEVQGQIYDKMIAETNRLYKAKEDAEKKAKEDGLKQVDSTYESNKAALKEQFLNGEIKTEEDFQKRMKALELTYLEERKLALEKWREDTTKINGQIQDAKLRQVNDEKEEGKKEGFKQIDATPDHKAKLDILQAMYNADKINYEEYEKEKARINEDYEQMRENRAQATFDVIGQAASAASELVSALQNQELSKVSTKYDKQIKAAKKAGKDTTKLEEEKEEAMNQVKKKYADKQFAATVLQVIATTASAAMNSYNSMAVIPVVGPALGVLAAAAAIASGAAQISSAKQARDEAKGLKAGGYSDDYVEGYTTSGNPDEVAGAIPVHKNEFVTNHEGVANPHVRQFLDVFNVAQKNGSIRMINTTQILEQVRTRSGKYSGGYTNDEREKTSTIMEPTEDIGIGGSEVMKKVMILLTESNRLLGIISEKELSVDSRAVRDGIRRVEKLEKNVSRG